MEASEMRFLASYSKGSFHLTTRSGMVLLVSIVAPSLQNSLGWRGAWWKCRALCLPGCIYRRALRDWVPFRVWGVQSGHPLYGRGLHPHHPVSTTLGWLVSVCAQAWWNSLFTSQLSVTRVKQDHSVPGAEPPGVLTGPHFKGSPRAGWSSWSN